MLIKQQDWEVLSPAKDERPLRVLCPDCKKAVFLSTSSLAEVPLAEAQQSADLVA